MTYFIDSFLLIKALKEKKISSKWGRMKFIILMALSGLLFVSAIIVIESFLDPKHPDCDDCESGSMIV